MADLEKAKHLSKNALYTLVCDQQETTTKQDVQISELGNEITALKAQMMQYMNSLTGLRNFKIFTTDSNMEVNQR